MKPFKTYSIAIPQKGFEWHDEDAFYVSTRFPVYAVADGVTLSLKGELKTPRGSKPAAELFCKKSVGFLEQNFEMLSEKKIRSSYAHANKAVGELNKKNKIPLSAVAALVAVKEGTIFGSRLTDCGFAIVRRGKIFFKTPEYWSWLKRNKKEGYGVIDGKKKGLECIDCYKKRYKPNDLLLLFSDGFENHFKVKKFIHLFRAKNISGIDDAVRELDRRLAGQDEKKYGHERTLLIVHLL